MSPTKPPTPAERLAQITTPIFDDEMGERLKMARMKLGLDQAELGRLLGVSQSVVSRLERAHVRVGEFNLARFQAILGEHATYVLLGANEARYPRGAIQTTYWRTRMKRAEKEKVG